MPPCMFDQIQGSAGPFVVGKLVMDLLTLKVNHTFSIEVWFLIFGETLIKK